MIVKVLTFQDVFSHWETLKILYGYLSQRKLRKSDIYHSLEECIILGILDDYDKLIGITSLYVNHGPWGPFSRIENVAILEEYRGMGLGRELVQEALMRADNAGCYRCDLSCSEKNRPFYEKCGLEKVAVTMKKYFND